jgi:4-hydroxybutyryl-CoA dehydratase/vinylacetyl-CoA-Delta-isomerase
MGIRIAQEYRDGPKDGRPVVYRRQRLNAVVDDPELFLAVDHSANCFDIATDRPDLAGAQIDGEPENEMHQ